MSRYDEESLLPTIEEQEVTPENEAEVVRSIRHEEAMSRYYQKKAEEEAAMTEWERHGLRCYGCEHCA